MSCTALTKGRGLTCDRVQGGIKYVYFGVYDDFNADSSTGEIYGTGIVVTSGEVISTIDAINPGQRGITIYDKILPKEINKIMKKIGGKKYDDDNYFTKKEFYSSDKDPTSPDMPGQQRYSSSDPAEVVIDTDVLPEDNFLRVIPLSKEIKKKLLEKGAETFKEGGSIIASNPYGNYEPRAI